MQTVTLLFEPRISMFAEVVRMLFERDSSNFHCNGIFHNIADCQRQAEAGHRSDVLLVAGEFNHAALVAFSVLAASKHYFLAQAMLMASLKDPKVVLPYLAAGFSGFVQPKDDLISLKTVLRSILDGRVVAPPSSVASLTAFMNRGEILTRRELEIWEMLARGKAPKQIATDLDRSLKTVEAHKCNLMKKLKVHKRAHLVAAFFSRYPDKLTAIA